ncbi:hypothetical protein PUR61_04655 [Streptomyces sp. BE20]|uniref:hypothetical protein n=1 Tax=Streptomyces sp. BE20 TaxID=3002525 RepID=UPI002E761800|nr:hypothetical protein [Streptomyces sp. BE20]MEE1821492.1 hypothetical protein [Streptomyces sp. BE20]
MDDLVAGRLPRPAVMAELARTRPVFHSEADLQHAFARTLWELDREVQCRLEVRQTTSDGVEHLDLLCATAEGRTAVEFKYVKSAWSGAVGAGPSGEQYALKAHGAPDLARRDFVFDVARLERFCDRADQNGLALMVTNTSALWREPKPSAKLPRDHAFRLHEGGELTGELLWGGGDYPPNTRVLRGTYPLRWQPYSVRPGAAGEFRYLALFVEPGGTAPAEPDASEADSRPA